VKKMLWVIMVVTTGLALLPFSLHAQSFPSKPIRIIVPFSPGGGADASGRLVARVLGARMNHSIIVENRPGANGNIGTDVVAKSAPDGYTLLVLSNGLTISAATEKGLPYDPKKDLTPVLLYGEQALVLLINPKVPANNAQELLQLARAKPGTLTFAGSDPSTILATDMLGKGMKADIVIVPYKGAGQALIDVIGGQITGVITSFGSSISHIKSGTVRGIAVTTVTRSPLAPDLPTLAESIVPGYEFAAWYVLLAPGATPPEVLTLLNRELVAALQTQEVKDQFLAIGLTVQPDSLARTRDRLARDFTKWEAVAKAAGMSAK
jgi:tripartite-type tricarboxylate transporter receptor subunit TctC